MEIEFIMQEDQCQINDQLYLRGKRVIEKLMSKEISKQRQRHGLSIVKSLESPKENSNWYPEI